MCIVQESGKNLREHWCAGLVALLSGTLPLMRFPHVSAIWAPTCVLCCTDEGTLVGKLPRPCSMKKKRPSCFCLFGVTVQYLYMAFLSVLYPVSIKSNRTRFGLREPLPLLLLEPLFLLPDEPWQVLNLLLYLLYLTILPEYLSSAKY